MELGGDTPPSPFIKNKKVEDLMGKLIRFLKVFFSPINKPAHVYKNYINSGSVAGRGLSSPRFSKHKKKTGQNLNILSTSISKRTQTKSQLFPRCSSSKQVVVYHGTPNKENAKSMLKDGFICGAGNSLGSGIYFSKNINTAKAYAGNTGVYVKCLLTPGKIARSTPLLQGQFQKWCLTKNVVPDKIAFSSFLLKNGYHSLQSNDVIVLLKVQCANPSAWKFKDRRIKILGVFQANGKQIRI